MCLADPDGDADRSPVLCHWRRVWKCAESLSPSKVPCAWVACSCFAGLPRVARRASWRRQHLMGSRARLPRDRWRGFWVRRWGLGCLSEFGVQFLVLVCQWRNLEQGRSCGFFLALRAGPAPAQVCLCSSPSVLWYLGRLRLQETLLAVHPCSLLSCLSPEPLGGSSPCVSWGSCHTCALVFSSVRVIPIVSLPVLSPAFTHLRS